MQKEVGLLCLITFALAAGPTTGYANNIEAIRCDALFQVTPKRGDEPKPAAKGEAEFKEGFDYQIGRNGKARDLKKAKEEYKRSAELGNTAGMFAYAALLDREAYFEDGQREVNKWWIKLAGLNDPTGTAMLALANKYGKGGMVRSLAEYSRLMAKAAYLGDVGAATTVLDEFKEKSEITDKEKAVEFCLHWVLRDTEPSHQLAMAAAYESARGTTKDLTRSKYWYCQAASSGNEIAKSKCGDLQRK